MNAIKAVMAVGHTFRQVKNALLRADVGSFQIVGQIAATGRLAAHNPTNKPGAPACVCLSECTLPGLIGHCERYGRFGFVFKKTVVFAAGGRPCVYVDRQSYNFLRQAGAQQNPANPVASKLFGLANIYTPPGFGAVQDYTHEREWRLFDDLLFATTPPEFLIAPKDYVGQVSQQFQGTYPVIPIDTMFEWGA